MMVLVSVGWDREESFESNLHMCGKDDTRTAVYNVEKCTERGEGKLLYNFILKKTI